MALLAGAGIGGLFFGKAVAGMTFITGVVLVAVALGAQGLFLFFGLDAHIMAAAAAPASFNELIRGQVGGWNGI
jgi:hypothetical protein